MAPPDQQHVVHAPAPNNTPPGQGTNEVTVPRAQSNTVSVQLTTVHNWVELVYTAFNQQIPTAAKEIAILGVREGSIAGKGKSAKTTGDALEDKAAEGKTDDVDFTKGTRTADMSKAATAWDDLLFVVWTADDAAKTQHVDVYQCTIDPGKGESGFGTPYLLEGKLYHGYPGSHIAKKYPGNNIALHLYSETKTKIVVAREATNKTRIFKTLASTNTRGGLFVLEEDNDTIHMHFGSSTSATVGGWSVGCTVLKHKLGSTRYTHFKDTFNAAPNKQRIPYLVVSSEYVRSYGEWVKEVDKTPGQTPEPKTVIMADQLRSPKDVTGRYLPSIMTTEFANAVMAEAERLSPIAAGPPTKKSALLRQSIERALFTCAT